MVTVGVAHRLQLRGQSRNWRKLASRTVFPFHLFDFTAFENHQAQLTESHRHGQGFATIGIKNLHGLSFARELDGAWGVEDRPFGKNNFRCCGCRGCGTGKRKIARISELQKNALFRIVEGFYILY